ncbi:SNF2 family N-terminal domain-containing protein [Annulohypoxylon moriforme]|nr:SNF2 family N-terminal domain-containing protein [Annulohypoxylon moriforme]
MLYFAHQHTSCIHLHGFLTATNFISLFMETNNYLRPTIGSKRSSPVPTSEDREVKKFRTQPPYDEIDYNVLDGNHDFRNNEFAIPIYGKSSFQSQASDLSYGYQPPDDGSRSQTNNSTVGETANTTSSIAFTRQQMLETKPDVYCGASVYTCEQGVHGESQDNGPLSREPAASSSPELMEIDGNHHDTCFGVILITPTSSFDPKSEAHIMPLELETAGDILMFYSQNSGAYAGMFVDPKFIGVFRELRRLHLRLDAMLFISIVEDIGGISVTKKKKRAPVEKTREYKIRIVVYGARDDKETVGDLLSNAGYSLQHPYATEVIPRVLYDNPHFLYRPGAGMPELDYLDLDTADDNPSQTDLGDEIRKSHILRILETAGADGEGETVVDTAQSPRLRSTLMRHQILALSMMLEKESGYVDRPIFPPLWKKAPVSNGTAAHYRHTVTNSYEPRPIPAMGGILADDMGLGKTLSVLALICSSLDISSATVYPNQEIQHLGTLIVAPKSTIYGWMSQASEHIREGQVRMSVYHGPGRETLSKFEDYDVVITTYETLRSEWEAQENRPLIAWKWLRVILDEAHHIRNRSRKAFQSVCALKTRYRWCLTGTPIHNSLDDYGALLSFIQVHPFKQKSAFKSLIIQHVEDKNNNTFGIERLQALIRATCLRRTKQKTLELPLRFDKVHYVDLHKEDQALYDSYKKLCLRKAVGQEEKLRKDSSPNGNDYNILSLITYLQRICDHGAQLLPNRVKAEGEESSISFGDLEMQQHCSGGCSVRGGVTDNNVLSSISRTAVQDPICINCVGSEESSNVNTEANSLSGNSTAAYPSTGAEGSDSATAYYEPSAKVLALLEDLKQERVEGNAWPRKSVVFSSWVKMLDLVERALRQERIGFQRIDGQTSLEGRQRALQEFNNNPDYTVMLTTFGSSAEGVNLTVASTVHLLEPQWNPMVEAQAIDRIHRIGQTQEVTVIRYIVPNSVETHVQYVQEEKMRIIGQAMDVNDMTEASVESKRWENMKQMLA